jgi:RNA polymerase sigma-70 factor (subfamily 1)
MQPLEPTITEHIIDAIRGGDLRAFDDLFTRAGRKVYVYIANRMGPRLRQVLEPEDVLQEVYAKAFEAFGTFADQGRSSFGRWLVAIARNQIQRLYNHHFAYEKRDRDREVPLEHRASRAGSISCPHPAPESTPSQIISRDEEMCRMADAVGSLEPDSRDVVLKHVYEGMTLEEISRQCGVPRTTINYRYARALRQLGRAMRSPDAAPPPESS